jgi:hypothetical protein
VYVCACVFVCVIVSASACVNVCVYVLTTTTIAVDNTSMSGQALEFLLSYAEK